MTANTQRSDPQIDTPPAADNRTFRWNLKLPSRLTRGFHALQVRNYRLFWFGQLISLTGSWMQTTAQAWLVLQLTHSPFSLGLVTTLQFLPVTLLTLIGGVITDRFPKHRLIMITQTVAMLQALTFAVLVATGTVQIWHIYILAIIQGTNNAIDNPARQSFAVELVGKENLVNAVALNSMLFNGARIVGPGVAGLLIANFGIAPALFLNAFSFVAVLAGLVMMDPNAFYSTGRRSEGAVVQRLLQGFKYVRHTPSVLLILLVVAFVGTFGYNFSVLLPLLAEFVLHTNVAGFGGLSSFMGFGALLAALSTAYTRQASIKRLLIGSGCFSVILGALALSTNYSLSGALLVALGFAGIIFSTTANTLLQLIVPDELRGRVMSLYVLLFAGSTPIGGFLIGLLSSVLSVELTILLFAGICLAGVAIATIYRSRIPGELSYSKKA